MNAYPAKYGPGCFPNTPFGEIVVAEGDVLIFMDAENGKDRCPGTQGHPVETIDRAFELVPPGWHNQCKIYAAPGLYVRDKANFQCGKPLASTGSPLAIVGNYDTLLTVTQSIAPVDDDVTFAGPPLIPNQYQGLWITRLSDGARCQIARNGTNTITPTGGFLFFYPSGPVSQGQVFVIEECAVVVDTTSGITSNASLIGWQGVKLLMPGQNHLQGASTWTVDGCVFAFSGGGSFVVTDGATLACASFYAPFTNGWADDPGNPFTFTHFTAGLLVEGDTPIGEVGLFADAGVIKGVFLVKNTHLGAQAGEIEHTNAVFADGANATFVGGTVYEAFPLFFAFGTCFSDGAVGAAFDFDEASFGFFGVWDISNAGGDGIFCQGGSTVKIVAGMAGSGNVGAGVHVTEGSHAIFDPLTTVTGANDALVGAVPMTWAALSPDGFTEVNAGGPTLNRISPQGV